MAVVVPSDITLLENKMAIGKRKLRMLEWTGLCLTSPMLHIHYSKLDRGDMKAALQKKYDADDKSEPAVVCKKRQESIRKRVVCTNYMWGAAAASAGMVTWSFRRYNYQSRLIALPFIFYGMTFVGRYMGDAIVGRNAEYGRDRFLGELPGKVYYNPQED
mmetsp:Transcript_101288/g.160153  ORF Transcript_101288/g.160153 Transcript_101288/m.160153 type:complete len:160 (-) Transcript_101288:126-605(-)